jgi:cell division protease FtsH
MDLKRYFRWPIVAVLVVLPLFFFLYRYASSGTPYKQADTSQIVSMIEKGQVKSALLIDSSQTIQITPKSGQPLQASWVGNQGQQFPAMLQQQYAKGNLPQGYNIQPPKDSSIFGVIFAWLPFTIIILFFLFIGSATSQLGLPLTHRYQSPRACHIRAT